MKSKISKADDILRKLMSEKRIKSVEDKGVGSEVFDENTLITLYKLAKMGYINLLYGAISTGKEANVFKGVDNNEKFVAVKIYRVTTSDFKKMQYYIQGDPRFHVRTTNKRHLVYKWVNKEFRNLKRAYEAGVKVPKPIIAKNNVLVMEFIGDKYGNPAPILKHFTPSNPSKVLNYLIDNLKILFKNAGIVHGDLSSFNILIQDEKPVIIDLSQSMMINHPLSKELLNRDVNNITKDFKKLGVFITKNEILDKITDL
jgi:RIO kinase 1